MRHTGPKETKGLVSSEVAIPHVECGRNQRGVLDPTYFAHNPNGRRYDGRCLGSTVVQRDCSHRDSEENSLQDPAWSCLADT